jgi:hypothetical protein
MAVIIDFRFIALADTGTYNAGKPVPGPAQVIEKAPGRSVRIEQGPAISLNRRKTAQARLCLLRHTRRCSGIPHGKSRRDNSCSRSSSHQREQEHAAYKFFHCISHRFPQITLSLSALLSAALSEKSLSVIAPPAPLPDHQGRPGPQRPRINASGLSCFGTIQVYK